MCLLIQKFCFYLNTVSISLFEKKKVKSRRLLEGTSFKLERQKARGREHGQWSEQARGLEKYTQ